ncbi:EamA family transporter [Candidatus Gottesmanbacteria bacterium]|nr:EamA family transporter [Candidatus Gottesmanbacteria bacterium]
MNWQSALILSIVFAVIRGFLEKKLVAKVPPFLTFFYVVFWSTIIFLIFYFIRHFSLPVVYPEMMLLGILFAFGYGSFLEAMKINLSQSVIAASFYLLIPLVLSVFYLSEWKLFDPMTLVGQKNIIGILLTFVSMYMFVKQDKKKGIINNKWLFFMIVDVILVGIGTFWGKTFIDSHGPLETLISQSLGGLPVLFIINVLKKENFKIGNFNQILAVIDGLVIVGTVTFFYVALKNGPLSVVLPIQTLVITIAITLVGLFAFKEAQNMTRRKIAGMVLGILGVVLLMI